MKILFRTLFGPQRYRCLLAWNVFLMCVLTFASQLEILSLGILTNKNIDSLEEGSSSNLMSRVAGWLDPWIPISGNVFGLAFFLIGVALFKAFALFLYRFVTEVIAIKTSRDLQQTYFEHLQKMPMSFFQEFGVGSLSSRIVGDASEMGQAINACLVNYVQTPFTVVTTLILCLITSWQLSLLVFIGFPLILWPIFFISRKVKQIAKELQKQQEGFTSVLIDFISGVQTVKMFGMETYSLRKYVERNDEIAGLKRKSACYDVSARPIVHTIAMIFLSISMLWGLYALDLAISEAFFFCGLLYVFYEPVKKYAEQNVQIQKGVAAAERMEEVLSKTPERGNAFTPQETATFSDAITFDRVSFRYGKEWVLRDVTFTIHKGEKVALVGPSGSGKSTLVQLLPRLYEIEKGDIRIDGRSIQTLSRESLRNLIAFVPQDPFLFLDTIAVNIAFGQDYPKEEIEHAAKKAHAEEFICKMPKGYQTPLLASGRNLSGGQQQRLAIARALIKRAPLLVMDEATSSLDNLSEHLIKQTLEELSKEGATQLIIAHRLTTIQEADKIVYLEKGKVLGMGPRNELMKTCKEFAAMWNVMELNAS